GHLRARAVARSRHRTGVDAQRDTNRGTTRLLVALLGSAGVERAGAYLLPRAWRPAAPRLADLPDRRRSVPEACGGIAEDRPRSHTKGKRLHLRGAHSMGSTTSSGLPFLSGSCTSTVANRTSPRPAICAEPSDSPSATAAMATVNTGSRQLATT